MQSSTKKSVLTLLFLGVISAISAPTSAPKVVLTNDDGWATAQIRAQYNALTAAGFNVILSAPADNRSGSSSFTAPAIPLIFPCEFDSCPAGSPAQGFNATDTRINYVNAFPVDAARYGIQTLSPQFFSSPPDVLISGPNIGANVGSSIFASGTIGAACEGSRNSGITSLAFSGQSTTAESYTNLDVSTSSTIQSAVEYASATTAFIQKLFGTPSSPLLPTGIILNINYPSLTFPSNGSSCSSAQQFQYVFTRALPALPFVNDVNICNYSGNLPLEATVSSAEGKCLGSITVLDNTLKLDVGADTQKAVLDRLSGAGIPLVCYS
ncbi:sure-like protein [Abortiporus biennis]|nr:sure-like protein [Abortiporus biennis]